VPPFYTPPMPDRSGLAFPESLSAHHRRAGLPPAWAARLRWGHVAADTAPCNSHIRKAVTGGDRRASAAPPGSGAASPSSVHLKTGTRSPVHHTRPHHAARAPPSASRRSSPITTLPWPCGEDNPLHALHVRHAHHRSSPSSRFDEAPLNHMGRTASK
jgi:hypothetical protein